MAGGCARLHSQLQLSEMHDHQTALEFIHVDIQPTRRYRILRLTCTQS